MQIFDEIPTSRPHTPLLDSIASPADLRALEKKALAPLADQLRGFLLWSLGQSGGHFGAGLGVVELTIALHYLLETPDDRLLWDVGHQAYPHKVLTGRRDRLPSVRQAGGLAPFPARSESPFDCFGTGHSSTSISAALGMALASRTQGTERKVVTVVGDGAMTAGMAFEALAHAGHTGVNMLVILNDNSMSISKNVGGLSNYFARIWASRLYTQLRKGSLKALSRLPAAESFAHRIEEHLKGMVAPGTLFEELGFNYIGPVDGHKMGELLTTINNLLRLPGPQFLHVVTLKGKGFAPAEEDPIGYHAINKIAAPGQPPAGGGTTKKYQDVFGAWLCRTAERDERLMGITPAMTEGSGMVEFARDFPDRFFDVAIAEQHSVTLAAGLACEGMKPVLAIYSTFLQRGYDQLIHDVALQNLDVLFALDRAGLVGEDGPTHAGSFDLSYLRCIPNMVVMAPSDENETQLLLNTGFAHPGPAAVRYPRGAGPGVEMTAGDRCVPIGKGLKLRSPTTGTTTRVAILNFGALLDAARTAAETLDAELLDMRFVKPLDGELIEAAAATAELIVTVEENALAGGAGSAVNQYLSQQGLPVPVLNLGLPDCFLAHGSPRAMRAAVGLDAAGITRAIRHRLASLPTSDNSAQPPPRTLSDACE